MMNLKCWWRGHDPELREDMKVNIQSYQIVTPCVVLDVHGRTFYFGETHCKRCGAALALRR